ncbi:hypothetical protein JIQ42_08382 [Leishmania sp. Namibia]|uniref:hypothetical protein n=1 Tax=Leishmania sp. Namibia TaxID=2802991 RepID=UPI001B777473|nr:hypothetical protein JIQ42_08382 [Leishmania sp. Namibia]
MHADSSEHAQEAPAPHPPLLSPRGTAPVGFGGAATPLSGISHHSRADSGTPRVLATLWLDAECYTYEALCTAGAAAITVDHRRCDEDGAQESEEEQHEALSSDRACASGRRDRWGPLADIMATSDGLATCPRFRPSLRLIPLESMAVAHRRPSSAVRASAAGAATGASRRHAGCEEDEHKLEVMGGALTNDATHQISIAASSAAARAAQSTSSDPFSIAPSDADVRLDILEEVELCNVVPILPRTFPVEQLVQQLVPCTYVFAPRTTPPPDRERGSSAWHARNGANSPSLDAPAHPFSAALLRAATSVRYLAHLRKVSDHHLARLRAADSPLVTTEAVASAPAGNDEAFIEEDSAPPARAVPLAVPVYMHTTSLAACGGSDNVSSTAARTGESSDGDPDECDKEEGAGERKVETPAVPPAVGVCQTLVSRLAGSSRNASPVGVSSTHEAETRQGAAAVSAPPRRSEEAPSAECGNTPAGGEVNAPAASIRASVRGEVSSVAATGEASPHRAFRDGEREPRPELPARVPCTSTSPSSLMSAALENTGCCCGGERVACTSFADAQARYEQYRQLLLQGYKYGTGVSTRRSIDGCVIAKSADAEDSRGISAGPRSTPDAAPFAPVLRTAATLHPTANFAAAQELWSAATGASLAPSFMRADTAGGTAIPKITATGSDPKEADMSPLGATVSQQRSCPKLCVPLASPRQQGFRRQQQQPTEQQPLNPIQQPQGGAVVEWSSGTVSYTADTLGLYEEQQARSQRFYHLPPPSPSSPPLLSPVRGAQPVRVAHGEGSVSSAAATEDRSSLRGAVLAQLQRLSRFRRSECAMSHAAVMHELGDTIGPLALETAAAEPEREYLSTRPLSPVARHPSPSLLLSDSAASTPPKAVSSAALSARQCRCYRCLPLLVQFAQVPSLTSPVLRRYLDVLHQTALPGLPAQQQRHTAAPTSAVEAGVVSSPEEAPAPRSQRAPSSRTGAAAATRVLGEATIAGARASRDRRQRCEGANSNGRRRRLGADSAAAATSGSEAGKKGREGNSVVAPVSAHAPQAGGGAQRLRGAVDPLEVFPALQQWLKRGEDGGGHTKRMPPGRKRARTESADNALPSSGGNQQGGGAASPPVAQTDTSYRHQGPACAPCASGKELPRASGVDFPATAPTETVSAGVGSLDWVDDAVLDEVAVVGVVPRGHPHQLRLVAPSHAFCLTLTQRLEEVAEAAVQILRFMTPPHPALPSPMLAGMSRGTAAGKSSEETPDWRAWLEAQYFAAMWTALKRRLTPVEWQALLREACDSPFLGRWAKAAAALESDGEAAKDGGQTLRVEISSNLARSSEMDGAASPAAENDKALAAVHEALNDVRASVRSAAESHTSACLSAAEDLVARVVLTALVPILHRRITVMYELLRHFASKSLYMSHRGQCDAYQHWYSVTPSPAAVLRLLQRSRRFSEALARCYPQYHLSPVVLSPLPTLNSDSDGGPAARAAAASMPFPSRPLSCAVDKAGNSTAAGDVTAAASDVTARSPSKRVVHPLQLNGFSGTRAAASPVCGQACVTAPAESRGVESSPSPSSSSSPSTATVPIAATSAWMSLLPSSSDEASPQTLLQQQQAAMTYVPEAALLDPRYLQRFAWWMHRAHHNSGMNGSGSAISISGGGTGETGAEAQQRSRVASTVLSLPGDYLRVLPVQEQDASIRTVLRSIAQKGRTMDLWEMSQHIHTHHASYVYR